jgi:hypothetical protein
MPAGRGRRVVGGLAVDGHAIITLHKYFWFVTPESSCMGSSHEPREEGVDSFVTAEEEPLSKKATNC